ncbi:PLC-like phosphodiesterase [Mycena indigotica]|uniref:PLC-like phosphodiesterase n=1 Tax=Mycena indigotica TaxID=2126181 RepID=A0A8H6VU47_9AGAR|nr:PLC-like phosphodiesterase [Mycena indigotica]KAF7290178.1 PLC-like phosphodiesterase [Mycena indigotica]
MRCLMTTGEAIYGRTFATMVLRAFAVAALLASTYAASVPSPQERCGGAAQPSCNRAVPRATVCNGHAQLCGRSYGNVTFMGSHDSAFFSSDPFALARDQEVDIPTQLGLGVRMLQSQAHMNGGVIHFCHTSCALFDGGTVLAYLQTVKSWLDANPNEVLTLLFTNPEGLSIPNVWAPAFVQSGTVGIASIAFVPPQNPMPQSAWPTLGSMIDSGKRVVIFLDAGADGSDGTPVNYILPEFTQIWETPFDSTNAAFPCSVDRIDTSKLSVADHMYIINHFLDIDIFGILLSDPEEAGTTNGVSSIVADAHGCVPLSQANRLPNFVLLDFVNLGTGMAAINQLNGVS